MFPSRLLISSKHHKNELLAPLFSVLGTQLFVDPDFDTDLFGTFCGEVPRPEGPRFTVKEKCLAGMAQAKVKQGLASEGSFGPHPALPFVNCNEEWTIYIDLERNLEIFGHSLTIDSCHEQLSYQEAPRLTDFLTHIDFGQQGLILKNEPTGQLIQKGIVDRKVLLDLIEQNPNWLLETELRAHLNPKRQKNIIAAAQNLIARSQSCCPNCAAPNFWVTERVGNLGCCLCGRATNTYQALKYTCSVCAFERQEPRQDLSCEDPQFCPHCNP